MFALLLLLTPTFSQPRVCGMNFRTMWYEGRIQPGRACTYRVGFDGYSGPRFCSEFPKSQADDICRANGKQAATEFNKPDGFKGAIYICCDGQDRAALDDQPMEDEDTKMLENEIRMQYAMHDVCANINTVGVCDVSTEWTGPCMSPDMFITQGWTQTEADGRCEQAGKVKAISFSRLDGYVHLCCKGIEAMSSGETEQSRLMKENRALLKALKDLTMS